MNKVSRRRWLRFTTVAAAVLVAAGVWLALYPWSRPVDLDVLVGQTLQEGFGPELLPEGARFASGAEAVLPRSMNTRYITAPARKLEEQDAAVFFFRLPAVRRGRSAVEGHLVIVPMSRLLAVPAATAFGNDPPVYRTGGYCTMSWVEGEFAYVCCVKGGENDLKRLSPPRPVAI